MNLVRFAVLAVAALLTACPAMLASSRPAKKSRTPWPRCLEITRRVTPERFSFDSRNAFSGWALGTSSV